MLAPPAFAQKPNSEFFNWVRAGQTDAVKAAITTDTSIANTLNERGHSPLIIAAYNNQIEVVKILLKSGAKVNYSFSQGNALHGAAYRGHQEIASHLIKAGCNTNLADENGSTPLMYATIGQHATLASLLLKHGADPLLKDNTGTSALEYAQSLGLKKLAAEMAQHQSHD